MSKEKKKAKALKAAVRYHIQMIRSLLTELNSDNSIIIRIESAKVDESLIVIHSFDEVIDLKASKEL